MENPFRIVPSDTLGEFHILRDVPDPITQTPQPVSVVVNATRSRLTALIAADERGVEDHERGIRELKAAIAEKQQMLSLFPESGAGVPA